MTDKDIIKALECCDYPTDDLCCECCFKDEYHCTTALNEATIDLIKRQQAEIERLQKDSERLKKVQMQLDDVLIMRHIIKAEAIKEFAEMLKNDWIGNLYYCEDLDITEWIDNLVKEMVGDNNA